MDDTLIRKWNERVKPNDVVYFLGDFCFKKSAEAPDGNAFEYYRQKLNGDIIFILGNHDKNNGCKSVLQSAIIRMAGINMLLIHSPYLTAGRVCDLVLCGHVHEKWKFLKSDNVVTINVGVDVNNFMPVSINELLTDKQRWLNASKGSACLPKN